MRGADLTQCWAPINDALLPFEVRKLLLSAFHGRGTMTCVKSYEISDFDSNKFFEKLSELLCTHYYIINGTGRYHDLHNLWLVCRYVMGPFSGWWMLGGRACDI